MRIIELNQCHSTIPMESQISPFKDMAIEKSVDEQVLAWLSISTTYISSIEINVIILPLQLTVALTNTGLSRPR